MSWPVLIFLVCAFWLMLPQGKGVTQAEAQENARKARELSERTRRSREGHGDRDVFIDGKWLKYEEGEWK